MKLGILLTLAATLCAADKNKKPANLEPSPLDKYISDAHKDFSSPEAAHPAGSLWAPTSMYSNLGMDVKASRVDDLVTIVVNETFSAVATGDVKTARNASAQSAITAAGGVTRAAGPLANLVKSNTQTALQGQGETSRGAVLTANLSARVVQVLPNGYLVIEGTKRVQVSSENQVVTVRGVIRPVDLDLANDIPSNRIAQMEVQVNGKGVVNDSIRRPNFLYRLLLGILPF